MRLQKKACQLSNLGAQKILQNLNGELFSNPRGYLIQATVYILTYINESLQLLSIKITIQAGEMLRKLKNKSFFFQSLTKEELNKPKISNGTMGITFGFVMGGGYIAWEMHAENHKKELIKLENEKLKWEERYSTLYRKVHNNEGNTTKEDINPADYVFVTDDVAGYKSQISLIKREIFNSYVLGDYKDAYGINQVKGILLYGPPGTGKTNIARSIGKSFGAKTKVINGPELISKWVGKSEEALRDIFQPAVQDWKTKGKKSPLYVIIIDEIDVLCPQRSSETNSGAVKLGNNMTTQLLTILDGVDSPKNIFVVGVTNRPNDIDPALLRAGRLELHMKIDYPNIEDRHAILELKTKVIRNNNLLDDDVNLMEYAKKTEQFTGADLESLVRIASLIASKTNLHAAGDKVVLHSSIQSTADLAKVNKMHFDQALQEVKSNKKQTNQRARENKVAFKAEQFQYSTKVMRQ